MKIRQLHRQVAIALWLPLGLTMWTGLAYRLGRSWLGLSKDFGKLMMTIHTGAFLGESFSLLYVLCLGLGVVVLTVSGFRLINPRRLKQYHRAGSAKQQPETHPSVWSYCCLAAAFGECHHRSCLPLESTVAAFAKTAAGCLAPDP